MINKSTDVQKKTAILARMMAKENLVVRFANAQTASFNPEKRVLTLPNFVKETPDYVRFGFNAHEIAHAIFTPPGHKVTSLLNILEDIRIEKLIKRKYKGSAVFIGQMYEYLWANNFFGVDEISIKKMSFLDRLNVWAKCGEYVELDIPFSDEEQELVEKAFLTSSFNDVLALEKEFKKYLKKEKENSTSELPEFEPVLEIPGDEDVTESPDIPEMDNQSNKSLSDNEEDDDEEPNEEPVEITAGGGEASETAENEESESGSVESSEDEDDEDDEDEDDEEPVAETMVHLKEKTKELLDDSSTGSEDILVGTFDEEEHVIKSSDFWEYIETLSSFEAGKNRLDFKEFLMAVKPQVSYMVKQFEQKKRATEWRDTSSHKTGELDISRLSEYRFSDDIFMREDIFPEGKNHGLVLVIDFSASMIEQISGVCKQAIFLSMFARQADIPLKVYGFTSSFKVNALKKKLGIDKEFTPGEYSEVCAPANEVGIFELIDTLSHIKDFERSIFQLYNVDSWFYPMSGGTPLDLTAIILSNVIAKWKEMNGIEIVSSVFLTDGASSTPTVWDASHNRVSNFYGRHATFVDVITRKRYYRGDYPYYTEIAYDIYKSRTCSSITVIYMKNTRSLLNHFFHYREDEKKAAARAELQSKGLFVVEDYMNGVVDLYLAMKDKDIFSAAMELEIKEGRARSSFKKMARARSSSKVFVSLFMDTIA